MMLGDLELHKDGEAVIAQLRGEVDMSNAGDVVTAIANATPNEAFGVVLDLTGVDYLDSAGIHMVYRLRERLRSRGQLFQLVIPHDSVVIAALRLAGVERQIEISETLDEAVLHLRPTKPAGPEP